MKLSIVKSIIPFLFILFSVEKGMAQKDVSFFAGGNLIIGFPSADFSNGYSYTSGIDAILGVGLSEKVYATGTLGYMSYKNKDVNTFGKITVVPLKAGMRVYAYKEYFLAGNAGVGFLKDEVMTNRESYFVYDIGMGIHYRVILVGFYYDGWKRKNNSGSSNTFQIRVGIGIK